MSAAALRCAAAWPLVVLALGCGAAVPRARAPETPPEIAGIHERFEGSYLCPQGPTGLTLELRRLADGTATAVFHFHPLPANPDVPEGRYTLTGSWGADGAVQLAPERWLEAPKDYVMVGLTGTLDAATGRLAGTIAAPGPDFVFAHVLLPHDPYVFAADGAPGDARTRTDLAAQLAYADTRVTALVDRLLDRPAGEAPIVAILADEGPYPPRPSRMADAFRWEDATPEEVAVKFGTLLALHLPDAPGATDPAGYPAGMPTSPVNLFRHLFARYFGTDTPPLADTVLASNGPSPLRFIDRTELLAEGRRILADGAGARPGG